MWNNVEQKNNQKDVAISYIIGGLFYFIIGVFGAIGVLGRPGGQANPSII